MRVCSFLNHDALYDTRSYLVTQAREAIRRLVQMGDEIEFWFYKVAGFQEICLEAVLEAKYQFPAKRIRIVFVIFKREENEIELRNEMSSLIVMSVQVPFCIIDKIIMAPIRSDAVYFVAASKKFIRWIIDHSDYMISYVYSDLLESINEQYAFLMRKNDEYILDVTHKETKQFVLGSIAKLPDRWRFIVQKHAMGSSYREIGLLCGGSAERIRYHRHEASIRLQAMARQRSVALQQDYELARECACSIVGLSMEYANPDTLKAFEEIIIFLIYHCGVSVFILEQFYCYTPFAMLLRSLSSLRNNISIRILTYYPDTADMNLINLNNIPPFDEIQNNLQTVKQEYTRQLQVYKALIEQSDFVIVRRADVSSLLISLEKRIQKRKWLKVIEMKTEFPLVEARMI